MFDYKKKFKVRIELRSGQFICHYFDTLEEANEEANEDADAYDTGGHEAVVSIN